ncbi:hypothetical protein ACH3O9_11155 [Leeuwenhoekiella sp. A16]|uniref:hypothetical protein n=1 Tax=Leeuwenhoekiella sp. A16 TaxID=3141462 RepID=UPI003A7FC3B5
MITEEDREALAVAIGNTSPLSGFKEYLDSKGLRNSWGRPYSIQALGHYWQGRQESLEIEKHLFDYAEQCKIDRKAHEERKAKFKNSAA